MSEGPQSSPGSDVYTMLLAIACVFVLTATILLLVRGQQLFGSWLPFGGV